MFLIKTTSLLLLLLLTLLSAQEQQDENTFGTRPTTTMLKNLNDVDIVIDETRDRLSNDTRKSLEGATVVAPQTNQLQQQQSNNANATHNVLDNTTKMTNSSSFLIPTPQVQDTNKDANSSSLLCPLLIFLPFSFLGTTQPTLHFDQLAVSHMAAALLAVNDFNQRNGRVVSILQESHIQNDCTIQLSIKDVVNSDANPTTVARHLIQQGGTTRTGNDKVCAIVGPYTNRAAEVASNYVLGLDIPMVTHGTNDVFLTNRNLHPLVARTSVNLHVMGEIIMNFLKSKNRTDFVAILTNTKEFGDQYRETLSNAAKEILSNTSRVDLYRISPPLTGFLPNVGAGHALQSIQKSGYRNIVLALNDLSLQLSIVADYAEQFGLNRGQHVWVLALDVLDMDLADIAHLAESNANISKLVHGMATIRLLDGFEYKQGGPQRDDFYGRAWKTFDNDTESLVQQLRDLMPPSTRTTTTNKSPAVGADETKGNNTADHPIPLNYFQTHEPYMGSSFIYDSVMSIGLGKCQWQAEKKKRKNKQQQGAGRNRNNNSGTTRQLSKTLQQQISTSSANIEDNLSLKDDNSRRRRRGLKGSHRRHADETTITKTGGKDKIEQGRRLQHKSRIPKSKRQRNLFYKAIVSQDFVGASGRIVFGEKKIFPGSRKRESVVLGAFNFRRQERQQSFDGQEQDGNEGDPQSSFTFHLTDIHFGHPASGEWVDGPGGSFVFASGLTTPPLLNRDTPNQNYLSRGVQIGGLVCMSFALASIFASVAFLVWKRNDSLIIRSQPPFLHLLLFGAFILTLAMLTQSFDEQQSWANQSALNAACLSTPWLVSLGYNIIYFALFSKLWRIDRVMQFSRQKVKIHHVLGPLLVAILATLVVLITWTLTYPPVWIRDEVDEVTGESYGFCQSRKHHQVFIVSLLVLMVISTLACAYMAFRCRDIDKRFSESNLIFYTIFVQIQTLLLGIPVLVVLNDASTDASYLSRALLIFIIVMTTVGLMIGPKVIAVVSSSRRRQTGERRNVKGTKQTDDGDEPRTCDEEPSSSNLNNDDVPRKKRRGSTVKYKGAIVTGFKQQNATLHERINKRRPSIFEQESVQFASPQKGPEQDAESPPPLPPPPPRPPTTFRTEKTFRSSSSSLSSSSGSGGSSGEKLKLLREESSSIRDEQSFGTLGASYRP